VSNKYMEWLKKYDVFSKILAVLIAVVLWLYVAGVNDFEENFKIKNIVPSFSGIEELATSKNLMIVGEYDVDIEVSGSRNDILRLNESDIRVEADLSMVSGAGTYEIPYTVSLPSSSYTLRNKIPQKLTVKFDEEDVNLVPVKVNTDGLAADGYVVDKANIVISPKELKLVGLQEDVDRVAYAEVVLLQKELKAGFSGDFSYSFFDTEGKELKNLSVQTDYETLNVSIPVLKTKEVPLSIDIQGSDAFKKYINYTFEPSTIKIAGEEDIIEQTTTIVAGAVKISDISSGMTKSFSLTLPDGISNLSGEMTASATLEFDGLSKKTVQTTLIEVVNTYTLPSGYKIRPVTTSINVDILGTEETLKKVNSENVRAVADLQSTVLSRGTHPINVAIVVDGIENTAVSNPEDYIIYVEVS